MVGAQGAWVVVKKVKKNPQGLGDPNVDHIYFQSAVPICFLGF